MLNNRSVYVNDEFALANAAVVAQLEREERALNKQAKQRKARRAAKREEERAARRNADK